VQYRRLSIETENAALVAKACKIIEESEEGPSLEVLAEVVGRSPSGFHRMFKIATASRRRTTLPSVVQ
jgi:AraC family transcriptional regulator of adaptative response/methylated-DNA-[protein]-cysteine methyltransferase